MANIYSIITATGSYIPKRKITNNYFLDKTFLDKNGEKIEKENKEITEKFEAITTIKERRYVTDDLVASDIAYFAAKDALDRSAIDKEELDYIIVAHNFGDVKNNSNRSDLVPSLAARVKYKLQIKNPYTIAYDLPFGCPGWLQGVIQADYFIKSGDAKKILVIGSETLSRIIDAHDRDSMLYADGAGAVILESTESESPVGILAHATRSDTYVHSQMLYMAPGFNAAESEKTGNLYMKMNGRKLYQYALENVPHSIKACMDKIGMPAESINKVLIHQANGKMDDAILKRLYAMCETDMPKDVMPMTVDVLGNSSVATVPTLLDLILKGLLPPHKIKPNDMLVFASVGAGMNINALVYKVPNA